MYAKLAVMWLLVNGVVNGAAWYMFSWWNTNAVLLLTIASGLAAAVAVAIVRLRAGGAGGGGGGSTARASKYDSKGARGGDR